MKGIKTIVTIANSNIQTFKKGLEVFCSPSTIEGTEVTVKDLKGNTLGQGKITRNIVARQSGKRKTLSKVVIDNS